MCRPVIAILLVLLSLAAGLAAAEEPPSEAILADLPFLEVDEPNRVYVDLAPEGSSRRFPMMLDTGATYSVLTPRAARALGVRVRRLKRDPYRRKTVLGRDLLFYVDTRSSDTASKTGWEYGLLGGNFLAEYVLELDFEAQRVRFIDAGRFEVPESVEHPAETVLPLDVVGNRPGVTIEINGGPMKFLLDTGAPWGILLSGKFARSSGVVSRKVPGFGIAGVMGDTESELGEAERIALGPFAFERVPVVVAPKGWFNQGFPDDSVIGYDVLAQFLLRIDYARERLWLRRRADARVTLFGIDYTYPETGALFLPHREGYRAILVREGSTAQARGLEPGQILSEPALPPAQDATPDGAAGQQ
jgi:predicted aspartyl protease